MCRTVVLNHHCKTLHVESHKVQYWVHSCLSSIQMIFQIHYLILNVFYLPMTQHCIIHTQTKNATKNIEDDLQVLTEWFYSNKLSLDVQKTHFLIFRPRNMIISEDLEMLKLGVHNIDRVNYVKFLGIYIDDTLEWGEHIQHIYKKISNGSYAINKSKWLLSLENLKLLYYSLVHSHLNYGTILWGAAYRYRLNKLEKLQKICIRNVCNVTYNAHTDPLFRKLTP